MRIPSFHQLRTVRASMCTPMCLAAFGMLLTACSSDVPTGDETVAVATVRVISVERDGELTSLFDTALVRAEVRDVNGNVRSDVPLVWRVGGTAVESLGNGRFRAVRNGAAAVTVEVDPASTGVRPAGYHADVVTDTVRLNVQQRPARLISDGMDTLFTMVGQMRQWSVVVADARGNPLPREVTATRFQTANPLIATVDSLGVVRATGEGESQLMAVVDGLQLKARAVVTPRRLHTSCMTYVRRRSTKESCVVNSLILHAPVGERR